MYSSYTINVVWLQASTREPYWLQYLFLKTPNVTIRSVFKNQITYMKSMCFHSHAFSLSGSTAQSSNLSFSYSFQYMAKFGTVGQSLHFNDTVRELHNDVIFIVNG